MWLHIYYQFSIISLPKLFLIAGWKVAEGKGFNRSKLFCQWKSIQHLPTLTHRKNYLLEALSFGYIPFYFFHHPVTEFAHLYKNISKKNFFWCKMHYSFEYSVLYNIYILRTLFSRRMWPTIACCSLSFFRIPFSL